MRSLTFWLLGFVCGFFIGGMVEQAEAAAPQPATVVYTVGPCPDAPNDTRVRGCAFEDGRMYVRQGSGPFAYHHELGHLYDFQMLIDQDRDRFQRLIGDRRPWVFESESELYAPSAELFADAYALCALQASGRPRVGVTFWRGSKPALVGPSNYGYEVPWGTHRKVCRMIWGSAGLTFDAPAPSRNKLRIPTRGVEPLD